MLTTVDKLLLALWSLPLVLGLAVGVRAGGDDGGVVLFVTGIVAVMYAVVLAGMFHYARRRRRRAELAAAEAARHGRSGDRALVPGPGVDAPEERGRPVPRTWQLLLVIPAAVHLVAAEGGWTSVVIAAQLVTVLTMAAYVHERSTEPSPAV